MHFFCIFFQKNLVMSKKSSTFALAFKSKVLMHREKGALSAFEKRADDLNFLLRKKLRK